MCCLAFAGPFRIHELLAREERQFDRRFMLLGRDIRLIKDEEEDKEVLPVMVKWPKEDRRGKEWELEVFGMGSDFYPVRATKKWWACRADRDPEEPAFRLEDGWALTGRKGNEILRELLAEQNDYEQGTASSHFSAAASPRHSAA